MRPLARAAERPCVRPGCPSPARASLSFRYGTREAWLERLFDEPRPESYDLCGSHAARTRPPHGWQLRDRRPREEQAAGEPPTTPDHLGGEQTVAVLAAALRSVPAGPGSGHVEVVDDADPVDDLRDATGLLSPQGRSQPEDEAGQEGGASQAPAAGAGRLEDTASPVLEPPRTDAPPDDVARDDVAPKVDDERAPAHPPERVPRPVPAARERFGTEHDRAPGGPAQHW